MFNMPNYSKDEYNETISIENAMGTSYLMWEGPGWYAPIPMQGKDKLRWRKVAGETFTKDPPAIISKAAINTGCLLGMLNEFGTKYCAIRHIVRI
jgi:hypothetical protein